MPAHYCSQEAAKMLGRDRPRSCVGDATPTAQDYFGFHLFISPKQQAADAHCSNYTQLSMTLYVAHIYNRILHK